VTVLPEGMFAFARSGLIAYRSNPIYFIVNLLSDTVSIDYAYFLTADRPQFEYDPETGKPELTNEFIDKLNIGDAA